MSSSPEDRAPLTLAAGEPAVSQAEETATATSGAARLPAGLEWMISTHAFSGTQEIKADPPGQNVGRYRLLRLLGKGAFAHVWLAADDQLRRQVAVKIVRADCGLGTDREEWLAEARALAALDHEHILPVYDVGRSPDGSVYVVSKFVEGATLRQYMLERRPTL